MRTTKKFRFFGKAWTLEQHTADVVWLTNAKSAHTLEIRPGRNKTDVWVNNLWAWNCVPPYLRRIIMRALDC